MRWKGGRRSSNIIDRRGQRGSRGFGGGGTRLRGGRGGLLPVLIQLVMRKPKLLILVIIGFAVAHFMGLNPMQLLGLGGGALSGGGNAAYSSPVSRPSENAGTDELSQFVAVVLADTEDTWGKIFQQQLGRQYEEPRLVLFSGSTQTACGNGQAAMGPFYCPADKQVYIDLSFYDDLRKNYKAPGDFAQAYVIAHEVGHHLQTILGISGKIHRLKQGKSKAQANELSVRQELQADCFAGVWGYHAGARGLLEGGDVDEALTAAAAIGDDRLQKQSRGYISPESFTHGTSEQRQRWFKRGLDSGDINQCDTLNVARL